MTLADSTALAATHSHGTNSDPTFAESILVQSTGPTAYIDFRQGTNINWTRISNEGGGFKVYQVNGGRTLFYVDAWGTVQLPSITIGTANTSPAEITLLCHQYNTDRRIKAVNPYGTVGELHFNDQSGMNGANSYWRFVINGVEVAKYGTTAFTLSTGSRYTKVSSTNAIRDAAEETIEAVDNTDAVRKYRVVRRVYDAGGSREYLRAESDGSQSRIGFFGVNAVARQTLPNAGTVTAADIRTALISLGLCQ